MVTFCGVPVVATAEIYDPATGIWSSTATMVSRRALHTATTLPDDRVQTLRRAFDATMNDSAFRAEAERLGMEVDPVTGENVQALVSRIMATSADLARRAREILRPR